jgi:hypothetical protein
VSVRRSFWFLGVIASTVEGIAILLLWRTAAAQLPGGIVVATLVLASCALARQLLRVSRLNRSLNALGESKGIDPKPLRRAE